MPALAANDALSRSGSDLPVMLMTRPKPRACICGKSACVNCRTRVKFNVIAWSHFSSGASTGSGVLAPAQLTRISTEPSAASAASQMRDAESGSITSATMIAGALPPAAATSRESVSKSSRRRATTAIFTPSPASVAAMARPIPVLAPVTSAVRPLSCRSMSLPCLLHDCAEPCPFGCETSSRRRFDRADPPARLESAPAGLPQCR